MSILYKKILRPVLFRVSSETAHNFGIRALRVGLGSRFARDMIRRRLDVPVFDGLRRFGLNFANPLGMAAGFDKNGLIVEQLGALGFGFVEVGTVTFEPQSGNPMPRMFRLESDRALINRLGFNNDGTRAVVERLKCIKRGNLVVGVNIGKNKDVPIDEAIENYLRSFEAARDTADYIAVNVSSPNTPNLRELQRRDNLESLLTELQNRNIAPAGEDPKFNVRVGGGAEYQKPILLKIAPDLGEDEIEEIVDIALRLNIAGIIATNTTVERGGLKTRESVLKQIGAGGLSGKPLAPRSNEVIKTIYRHSAGKLPIIGVGGIFSPEDAFEKIAAGACLIQAYTGFVYGGITFARDVNAGLSELLSDAGFNSLDEAVGSSVR